MKSQAETPTLSCMKTVSKTDPLLVKKLKKEQILLEKSHINGIIGMKQAPRTEKFRCPEPRYGEATKSSEAELILSLALPFIRYGDLNATEYLSTGMQIAIDTFRISAKIRQSLSQLPGSMYIQKEMLKYYDWCTDETLDEPHDLNFPEDMYVPPSWKTFLGPDFVPIDEFNAHAYLYGLFVSDTYQDWKLALLPGPVNSNTEKPRGRFIFYISHEEAYTGKWTVEDVNGQPVIRWEGQVRSLIEGQFELAWNIETKNFDLRHGTEILVRRTPCFVQTSVDVPDEPWSQMVRRRQNHQVRTELTQRPGCTIYFDEAEQRLKYRVLEEKKLMTQKPLYASISSEPSPETSYQHSEAYTQAYTFWAKRKNMTQKLTEQHRKELRAEKRARKLLRRNTSNSNGRSKGRSKNHRQAAQNLKGRRRNSRTASKTKNRRRRRPRTHRNRELFR